MGCKLFDCQHGKDRNAAVKRKQQQREEWKSVKQGDLFFFRPYSAVSPNKNDPPEGHSDTTLLFVHQSSWQHRLLQRYGNHMCLLDATCKTTQYALPLFFLVVQTNVDYQVVGSFITQNETSACIKEALQILQGEMNGWNPKYFMTDNCEQEITAIEEVFPGCKVFLCDFHREQAWERWTAKSANGVNSHREEVLAKLRLVASAESEELYASQVKALKECHFWKENSRMRDWFENHWLREHKVSKMKIYMAFCFSYHSYNIAATIQQPSCQCFSWVRNHFPCKHFFAIF
ncbi:uncharacterized protein [Montipora foliosa]|uniref:uncharacterized protein n=1 Tax=Montipora foliosa TaxID=591990 RepID=UPI0035F11A43